MKKLDMRVEKDFKEFLELLNKHKVKYCVVGAYAVAAHILPRYTKDIDIFVERSRENARKILKAIDDFGIGTLGLTENDFIKKENIIQLGHEPVRIDIIMDMSPCPFKEAWRNRIMVTYGKEKIYIIGLEDLVKTKKTSGRKIDEVDLEKLMLAKKWRKTKSRK